MFLASSHFFSCRSLSTTVRNCSLLHELWVKWRRGKVKMRNMQKKRQKLRFEQFGFATDCPAVCSRPVTKCVGCISVCGAATVLSLPSSHVSPWWVWLSAVAFMFLMCVCVCRQSVCSFSEVVPEQRGTKVVMGTPLTLKNPALLPPWLGSSRALVNALYLQCVLTPLLCRKALACSPGAVLAGTAGAQEGGRKGSTSCWEERGNTYSEVVSRWLYTPWRSGRKKVQKLVMGKGTCMHMFGKAQGMSSAEIATLSEYNHINILCPRSSWAITYH